MRLHVVLAIALLGLSATGCSYAYGVRGDDPAITLPCRYGSECDSPKEYQFASTIWHQLPDTTQGHRLAQAQIEHLEIPYGESELGYTSTLEFMSFDSAVTIDPASVVIVHRTLTGGTLVPNRVETDTTLSCATCDRFVRVRVRAIYGYGLPRRVSEEVSFVVIARGERVHVSIRIAELRYRLRATLWDALMGI